MLRAKKHLQIAIRNREIIDTWLLERGLSPWNVEIERMLVCCLESDGTVEELVNFLSFKHGEPCSCGSGKKFGACCGCVPGEKPFKSGQRKSKKEWCGRDNYGIQ
jgi:hypothetical protein